MSIVCSDGLEYADLTQRLLGRPLDNPRNRAIWLYRTSGYSEAGIKVWWKTYDASRAAGAGHEAAIRRALDNAYGIDGFATVAFRRKRAQRRC